MPYCTKTKLAKKQLGICQTCTKLVDPGNVTYCKYHRNLCKAAAAKRKTKPEYKISNREWYRRYRTQVLEAYGGKCACCGESTYEFLAIDHIAGGGRKHRESTGNHIYSWLVQQGYPEGFQVLCHNCNSAKGYYKQCPHERERLTNAE